MVTLNVNFENPQKFFFEGEKVCVKLEVCVDRPVNIASILANFVGTCRCDGDATASNDKCKAKEIEEVYFDEVIPLFVATDENSSFSKGMQFFTVAYQLPNSLPTSVETPRGWIRYTLHITADVREGIVKATQHFTVISKVDLNSDAASNQPIVLWKHENQCIFTCLCMRSGAVRAFLHTVKRGYVPGEFVTVNAEIRNFNRSPISWVKVCIIQIIKYNCGKASKRKRVVAEVTRGCIMPFNTQAWRSENIFIPAIPPTTYPPKRMIKINYKLYLLIKPSWQERTITLKQGLIIGAVPLMECKGAQERGQGEGENILGNDSCLYSNLEPCIFGPHSLNEEHTSSFSPYYPMYTELYN